MTTVIKNAFPVICGQEVCRRDITIKDGKIFSVGRDQSTDGAMVIDAEGGYVFPGFIDEHVHGGGGADFMDAEPEAFETAVKAHLKHGTTQLLPTAMTATREDLLAFVGAFKEFKAGSKYGKNTPGIHLEGPYFSGANAKSTGAQKNLLMRAPDPEEIDSILNASQGYLLRWDAAPDVDTACVFARKMRDNGIICSMAHSAATSEQAQKGIDNGFNHVTHFYNAVTTYHKKDQTVCGGVVEAAYLNDDVVVEFICDGKHIPRDIMRLALKIKSEDKVMGITDAMRIAGTDMKFGKLGNKDVGTDVIVDDGVAKLPDMSSFAGSIATMDRCLAVLCRDYGFDVRLAAAMLCETPAKHLGLFDKKGSITEGKDADLVVTDENFNLKCVIFEGKTVE